MPSTTQTYPADAIIIRQGDPADTYYLITEGSVTVRIPDGEVAALTAGQGFGETALLDEPRNATITTRTPVAVLEISRADFLAALSTNPKATKPPPPSPPPASPPCNKTHNQGRSHPPPTSTRCRLRGWGRTGEGIMPDEHPNAETEAHGFRSGLTDAAAAKPAPEDKPGRCRGAQR